MLKMILSVNDMCLKKYSKKHHYNRPIYKRLLVLPKFIEIDYVCLHAIEYLKLQLRL